MGRHRGPRGAALSLLGLLAGTCAGVAVALLPPHAAAFTALGVAVGLAGVGCFVWFGHSGRTVAAAAIGLLTGLVFWSTAMYAFQDAVLALTGRETTCTVRDVSVNRGKGTSEYYHYELACPGQDGTSTLRGVHRPPPADGRVTVILQPDALVEPERPEDVSPVFNVTGVLLSGACAVVWASLGARRRPQAAAPAASFPPPYPPPPWSGPGPYGP